MTLCASGSCTGYWRAPRCLPPSPLTSSSCSWWAGRAAVRRAWSAGWRGCRAGTTPWGKAPASGSLRLSGYFKCDGFFILINRYEIFCYQDRTRDKGSLILPLKPMIPRLMHTFSISAPKIRFCETYQRDNEVNF